MANIVVVTRTGETRTIEAALGTSVMELIRGAGIDELAALCGGSCSCATCHVYIEADQQNVLPAVSEAENDLLDGSDYRNSESRLSCQLIFRQPMDGLRVTIAPEG